MRTQAGEINLASSISFCMIGVCSWSEQIYSAMTILIALAIIEFSKFKIFDFRPQSGDLLIVMDDVDNELGYFSESCSVVVSLR